MRRRGITGQRIRVEERGRELAIFHAWTEIRCLSIDQLVKGNVL